jgi:hypothetical protein
MEVVKEITGRSAFIRKFEERNEAVLKNQELSSKLTKLEVHLASSDLKLQELQSVHDRFVLKHEIEIEANRRVIFELEENSLRLMPHETSLRRTIEEKDRLLQAKKTERVARLDRYKKSMEDLLDQLIHITRIREDTLKNLAAAEVKPETRDVGCVSDEPLVSTDPTVVTVCSPSEPDDKEKVIL